MVKAANCITVQSILNEFIDLCIAIHDPKKFSKAEKLIKEVYDMWWDLTNDVDMPIVDWITFHLDLEEIEYDIYFKEESED